MKRLRILLSAYACEPHKGSEPGIGWDWSVELARQGHEVWVLTRANNRSSIEKEARQADFPSGIHFLYHDLPKWVCSLKKRIGATRLYYLAWLFTARRLLRQTAKEYDIDVYHHLTFAVDWVPSFPPKAMPCSAVRGPLGGYYTSDEMKNLVPRKYAVLDAIKKVIRRIGLRLVRREMTTFDLVLSNNEWFKKEYLAIAPASRIECVSTQTTRTAPEQPRSSTGIAPNGEKRKLVLGGRLLYWKGYDVALAALGNLVAEKKPFEVTIIGRGAQSYRKHLERQCAAFGLSNRVRFVDRMPQSDFHECVRTADVFLYPSFYGSADSVMIEVIELGTPLVCFPSGGATELLGDEYPYRTASFSMEQLSQLTMAADRRSEAFVKAREAILAKHSRTKKIAQIVDFYTRLIDEARPRNRWNGKSSNTVEVSHE